jgi:xeroderma pigmentosum group C-complementing protein
VPTGGEIYQDMLTEAGVNSQDRSSPERPLKRRRAGQSRIVSEPGKISEAVPKQTEPSKAPPAQVVDKDEDDDDEDEDIEFEDVVLPQPTM